MEGHTRCQCVPTTVGSNTAAYGPKAGTPGNMLVEAASSISPHSAHAVRHAGGDADVMRSVAHAPSLHPEEVPMSLTDLGHDELVGSTMPDHRAQR